MEAYGPLATAMQRLKLSYYHQHVSHRSAGVWWVALITT